MSEMIERVAIAIAKIEQPDRDYISLNQFGKGYYQSLAKAAIEAMREPTDAMCEAAEWHQQSEVNQYQAAIDAALDIPSQITPHEAGS